MNDEQNKADEITQQLIDSCQEAINGDFELMLINHSPEVREQSLSDAFPDSELHPALANGLTVPKDQEPNKIVQAAQQIVAERKKGNNGPS